MTLTVKDAGIITWNDIDPGVSQVWTPIDPLLGELWHQVFQQIQN